MQLTPEERQRIYEEEKARIEAQERIKAEQASKTSSTAMAGCVGLIFIVAFLLFMLSGLSNSGIGSGSIEPYSTASSGSSYSSPGPATTARSSDVIGANPLPTSEQLKL